MKRCLLILLLLMLPMAAMAAEPDQIETNAVHKLYKVGTDIAKYGDGLDPMSGGKFSKDILSQKIAYYELALTAMKQIVDDSDYQRNKEGLAFKDTYNKAAAAKTRIESQLAELKKYAEGEVLEDGELDGSGWFSDDKYNNDDFKTKLLDSDDEDNKDESGFLGMAWYIWMPLAAIILYILMKNRDKFSGAGSKIKGRYIRTRYGNTIIEMDKRFMEKLVRMIKNLKDMRELIGVSEVAEPIMNKLNELWKFPILEKMSKRKLKKRFKEVLGGHAKEKEITELGMQFKEDLDWMYGHLPARKDARKIQTKASPTSGGSEKNSEDKASSEDAVVKSTETTIREDTMPEEHSDDSGEHEDVRS